MWSIAVLGVLDDRSHADCGGGDGLGVLVPRRDRILLSRFHLPADGRPSVGALSPDEAGGGVERERGKCLRAERSIVGGRDLLLLLLLLLIIKKCKISIFFRYI